ncbi:hypothetical protein ACFLRB_02260 [Acidobacteriota bacterium]
MNVANQKIDMSVLPENVQKELFDFYHYLVEKYGNIKEGIDNSNTSKLPGEFYNPLKVKKYHHFNKK